MNADLSSAPNHEILSDFHVTGWRIVAALVDFIPLTILFLVMATILGDVEKQGLSFNASLGGLQTLHFAGLALVHYVLMEGVCGTTLGKMMLGLKVIKLDGGRYGWKSALTRNISRVVDVLPIFYLVGVVSIGVTDWKQRLGDLAAGTQVVRVVSSRQATPGATSLSPNAEVALPTDAGWKVSMAPRMAVAIVVAALISGFTIYVSSTLTKETTRPIPSDEELRRLTTETIVALDQAIQAKDFTSFYGGASESLQHETTPISWKVRFRFSSPMKSPLAE